MSYITELYMTLWKSFMLLYSIHQYTYTVGLLRVRSLCAYITHAENWTGISSELCIDKYSSRVCLCHTSL